MDESTAAKRSQIERHRGEIGRKTPEGLLRWMREGRETGKRSLDEKIRKLKMEMAHLRSVDVKILQQLLAVHEGIEAVKWLLEERSTLTSRCSSLTSSQYSLGEGPDTSWRGSWSSLQDPNDKLDNISIGSYLDTLADDMDEYCPSSSESVISVTNENGKHDPPVWTKADKSQTQVIKANGVLEKPTPQTGSPTRSCLNDKLGSSQSPKLKPYKNGKIDLDTCKMNGKMHLEYDAHWRWVQSQEDVTFL
uniref:Leucine rich adaptor protein 1 n=1 Tax=Sphaeramia orbicularis TaxID=375764 RepID=A0A672YAR7_9TELE